MRIIANPQAPAKKYKLSKPEMIVFVVGGASGTRKVVKDPDVEGVIT
jgi:hypothetical protein